MAYYQNYLSHFLSLIELKDFLDVLIVASLFYVALIFIRQTRSYFIFYAIVLISGIYFLSTKFDLGLTRQIFQPFLTFAIFFLAIIFQRDLRRFFDWFFISGQKIVWEKKKTISDEVSLAVMRAVDIMSKKKIGALLVFPGDYPLDTLVEGGWLLDGKVSSPLLLSIFDTSSPGHDGAVIIDNNRLYRFGVHLPLAENYQSFDKAGTRHRAGAGITERSDALAVIVSEERGDISIARDGKLQLITSVDELRVKISDHIKVNTHLTTGFWHYFLARNTWMKVVSVSLAFIFWFSYVFSGGTVTKTLSVPIEARFIRENLVVEQVSPQSIKVTVTGNEKDLRGLDSGQVKAIIDLPKAEAGWQDVQIKNDNISYPAYVKLIKIDPQVVKITLRSKVERY
ncbi:MAG: putative membrane protein [Parcubacteria group bacterium GW2011_GWC1_43_11b]|uniref:Diadenylate cyclase n=2 Tax=Candidatus Vogeliibacteriota TaxID=1817922 RepID=A0A1G2QEY8_9BACT|nr:MAG: putative membrane protein [Parcubacteria group bacterium GW2011_GWB1_42_9]KKS89253.1 MAG: putative membrane protein [Parcubacteria group bacterium GW2011_GWC1_43_11b]KKT10129.1 MAG: putative membrane protein [Parcubacteria group bacterium GW2011_GWA1_43_21]OHA59037.1 MAG: hypothetical protein A2370_00760 [Candidatus Vogelbacteria bacterium RIFOXYB1_FULL_42_16]OHA60004.1 MAG: hypothetical protein A2607_01835 [Candidatus Vogelbacteria bacterium RIFOXYD1_FULL_42_15]